MIELVDVYQREKFLWVYETVSCDAEAVQFLYALLAERPAEANISHVAMPTYEDHCLFVLGRPYAAWYVVMANGAMVGSVYLSKHDEIGIQIDKRHNGKGYAMDAIRALMERHPRERYLANIAPGNAKSIMLFGDAGFKLVQLTYELRP
jgi:RimJ/RimL family protein N-acetyltransferase